MVKNISSKIFFGGVVAMVGFISLMSTAVAQSESGGTSYPSGPQQPSFQNNTGGQPSYGQLYSPAGFTPGNMPYYRGDGGMPSPDQNNRGGYWPSIGGDVGGDGGVGGGMDMMRAMEDRLMMRIEALFNKLIANMMVPRVPDNPSREVVVPTPVADPIMTFLSSLTVKMKGGTMACPSWIQKSTDRVFNPQASARNEYCIGQYMTESGENISLCAEMKDAFHLDAKNYSSKTCPAFVSNKSPTDINRGPYPMNNTSRSGNYWSDPTKCLCASDFCAGPFDGSGVSLCVAPENNYNPDPKMICAKRDGGQFTKSNYSASTCPPNIKEMIHATNVPSGSYPSGDYSGGCGSATSMEECGGGPYCRWSGNSCYYESGSGSDGMNNQYYPPYANTYQGGTSSMKRCLYDRATKYGASVNGRIWCESDYNNCHMDSPSGAVVSMDGLALGGPTSCEEGWSNPTNGSVSQGQSPHLLASLFYIVFDPFLSLFGF